MLNCISEIPLLLHERWVSNEQARIRFSQGEIAWSTETITAAEEHYRETMAFGQENHSDTISAGAVRPGENFSSMRRPERCVELFSAGASNLDRFGATDYLSYILEGMAVLAASSAPGLALTASAAIYADHLHGAGQALSYLSRLAFYYQTHFEPYDMESCLAPARAVLGEEAYARAYAEGQAMKLEQAVEYA